MPELEFNWHSKVWQNLIQSYRTGRLAHGLIFHGSAGTGKGEFARQFANWLICEQNSQSDTACGQCRHCQLFNAETYPDYFEIFPEDDGKAIKVDQVRTLIEKISLTGHGSGYRVVFIAPADAMNINAANSLLKTLEEPPENTLLILVTDRPSALMPTIRSRAQMVRFDMPTEAESITWLEKQGVEKPELLLTLAGGSPIIARNLANQDVLNMRNTHFQQWQNLASGEVDALNFATSWTKDSLKLSPELPLNWIHSWILDMIRHLQGVGNEYIVNPDYANTLQNLAGQVDLTSLYNLLDRVNETLRLLKVNSAANQQALIEGIFLHWSGMRRITN